MNISRPVAVGPQKSTTGVSFPDSSGGSSPGAGDGLRADWEVRMNVSHSRGFVGGAGRLLIHNEKGDDLPEIVLYLPANRNDDPGHLRLISAVVCSAKPGIPAASGQSLSFQAHGARVVITIPLLKMNDWIFVDLTWDGGFPTDGTTWPGGAIPLGHYHPQVAVPVEEPQGALYPIPARYEVTLGSDLGAVVRLETEGAPTSQPSEDGQTTMHHFRSYGKAAIQAKLAPPGSFVN